MKYITIISSALIALACPMVAHADDFNYDEPTVEVDGGDGGTHWEGDTPGVDIEVDNEPPTAIQQVEASDTAIVVKLNREASTITLTSQTRTSVTVYRIGAPSASKLKLNPGENTFNMPRGIYIINGRKYLL